MLRGQEGETWWSEPVIWFNHKEQHSSLPSTFQWEDVGQTKGKSHAEGSAVSVCQRFRLASLRAGLRTVCVYVCL